MFVYNVLNIFAYSCVEPYASKQQKVVAKNNFLFFILFYFYEKKWKIEKLSHAISCPLTCLVTLILWHFSTEKTGTDSINIFWNLNCVTTCDLNCWEIKVGKAISVLSAAIRLKLLLESCLNRLNYIEKKIKVLLQLLNWNNLFNLSL